MTLYAKRTEAPVEVVETGLNIWLILIPIILLIIVVGSFIIYKLKQRQAGKFSK